jgi:HAD superfamily hydrolase (TIGR01549 family)
MLPAAVVFDLDGTLVDSMTIVPAVYVDTIRALGGPAVTPESVVATWHIGTTPVVLARFLGRTVTDADLACYRRHFATAAAFVRPFAGIPDLLEELREAGCRLGVYTSATRSTTALVLGGTGLDRLFPVVVAGDDVHDAKPAPEGLRLACRRLGVDAAEAVYVGDAVVDLECAAAAGARAVHARWGTTIPTPASAALVARRPADVRALLSNRERTTVDQHRPAVG